MPMNPGPSPCSLRPVLPLVPLPESGPTFATQLGALSHDSHPCAPGPAPSPSQTTSRPPSATGVALAAPMGGFAAPMAVIPVAAVAGAAPAAVGQGGQRQPAVPRARTASDAHAMNASNLRELAVIGSILRVNGPVRSVRYGAMKLRSSIVISTGYGVGVVVPAPVGGGKNQDDAGDVARKDRPSAFRR